MEVKINKLFRPLYETKKRYTLLTGGRGSLKSSTVHDFVARLTYEQGHGILFTRYTMASAELSIIPEFRGTLMKMGIDKDFKITKNRVTNRRTGSFIYFSGIKTGQGDQTGRLKSIAGITTWIIEEGEDFRDEKTFNIIDDSIRTSGKQNRIIWIQNPTTPEHFIHKQFIEPKSKQIDVEGFKVTVSDMPEVEHIHTTYKIAERLGYLDKQWLAKANKFFIQASEKAKQLKRTWTGDPNELEHEIDRIWYSSHYYSNYIGGWLEKAEGVIFHNWIEGKFNDMLPFCYGLDFGYNPDPLALVKVAINKRKRLIHLKEEIYETELDDIPARLDLIGVQKRSLIVCDTNEERTQKAIQKAGFNIDKAEKDLIVDDIREIKTWTIVVDPFSRNIKRELNNWIWNDQPSIRDTSGICSPFGKRSSAQFNASTV